MTITMKPKKVREPIARPNVLSRPPAEPSRAQANAAANAALPLPEPWKKAILAEFDRFHTYVAMGLPTDDLRMATKLVHNRLFDLKMQVTSGAQQIDVCGGDVGLQLHIGGRFEGAWSYEGLTLALLERAPAGKPAGKKPGKTKAAPPTIPTAALQPPGRELMQTLSTGELLDLEKLQRHPENRAPFASDVQARAESLQADGQLEDVVVRRIDGGGWQIISGETRCLAARSLGWSQVRCTVILCDDAEALRLVGLYNAQRADLTPIQKAQHIRLMCAQGMTREEAARCVGLASGGAASNLVKLLELPQVWQDRVAAGELPETFARSIAAYAHVPALLAELDEVWQKDADDWERRDTFGSREDLDEAIQKTLPDVVRPLRGERYYGAPSFPKMQSPPTGTYPVLISADELAAHREALGVVTVTLKTREYKSGKSSWKSQEVEVATNIELFDQLQTARILEKEKARGKGKAKAAGAAADAGEKKPQTAAEKKAAAEERSRQLRRGINDWGERVMRREIAAAIRLIQPAAHIDLRLLKLVAAFMADGKSFDCYQAGSTLGRALGVKVSVAEEPYLFLSKALLGGNAHDKWQKALIETCAYLIGGEEDDPRPADLGDEVLLALFHEWGCSMEVAWARLYRDQDPLIEEFLQLHRKDELADLCWEIAGVKFAENATKSSVVTEMLALSKKPPKLPKSLQLASSKKKREIA